MRHNQKLFKLWVEQKRRDNRSTTTINDAIATIAGLDVDAMVAVDTASASSDIEKLKEAAQFLQRLKVAFDIEDWEAAGRAAQ